MRFSALTAADPSLQTLKASPNFEVVGIRLAAELEAGALVFVKNAKFLAALDAALAKAAAPVAAVLDKKLWEGLGEKQAHWESSLALLAISPNVPLSMARLSRPLFEAQAGDRQFAVDGRQFGNCEIHPSVIIAQGVQLGERVKIGANARVHSGCVIESDVEIGEGCELFANVVVYSHTRIGKRVRVHANTTIGSDGFGYVHDQGVHHKIWHMGGVVIHDDVEIGANCSVDMGAFTPTVIGAGTKIDNQVQVAHNVKLGRGVIVCGQAGIAGSAVLEDYVVLGGRVAIGPDAHIGMGSQVAGGAMVNEGAVWPKGSVLGGHPARDLKEWMKTFAWVRKNALKA